MRGYIQKVGETVVVAPKPSPTWTVNCKYPDWPPNVPFSVSEFRESVVPTGSGPCLTVNEYGAIPPLNWPNAPHAFAQPSSTLQSLAQAGRRLAERRAAMLIEPGIEAVASPESAAWIVNVKWPELVGLPETLPSEPSETPGGSAPPATDHR